jgi:hypothetical protein
MQQWDEQYVIRSRMSWEGSSCHLQSTGHMEKAMAQRQDSIRLSVMLANKERGQQQQQQVMAELAGAARGEACPVAGVQDPPVATFASAA